MERKARTIFRSGLAGKSRSIMRQVATMLTIYWFFGCSVALAQEGGGATLRALELHECIQLAKARQPRLAAQRTDLALAENGKRALDSFKLVGLLDAEIPIRRRQAELGLAAASTGLDQAEREMIYAVTRTYITVQYAREQETLARGVVERLGAIHQAAATQLKAGARDITDADVTEPRCIGDWPRRNGSRPRKASSSRSAPCGRRSDWILMPLLRSGLGLFQAQPRTRGKRKSWLGRWRVEASSSEPASLRTSFAWKPKRKH